MSLGTSLVAQWLRIYLLMQGTQVRALVREDSTFHGATKPVRHNWACALEPVSHNYWGCMPQLLKPAHLEPMLLSKRSHRNEKPAHCNEEQPLLAATGEKPARSNEDPTQPKKKKVYEFGTFTIGYKSTFKINLPTRPSLLKGVGLSISQSLWVAYTHSLSIVAFMCWL